MRVVSHFSNACMKAVQSRGAHPNAERNLCGHLVLSNSLRLFQPADVMLIPRWFQAAPEKSLAAGDHRHESSPSWALCSDYLLGPLFLSTALAMPVLEKPRLRGRGREPISLTALKEYGAVFAVFGLGLNTFSL